METERLPTGTGNLPGHPGKLIRLVRHENCSTPSPTWLTQEPDARCCGWASSFVREPFSNSRKPFGGCSRAAGHFRVTRPKKACGPAEGVYADCLAACAESLLLTSGPFDMVPLIPVVSGPTLSKATTLPAHLTAHDQFVLILLFPMGFLASVGA